MHLPFCILCSYIILAVIASGTHRSPVTPAYPLSNRFFYTRTDNSYRYYSWGLLRNVISRFVLIIIIIIPPKGPITTSLRLTLIAVIPIPTVWVLNSRYTYCDGHIILVPNNYYYTEHQKVHTYRRVRRLGDEYSIYSVWVWYNYHRSNLAGGGN